MSRSQNTSRAEFVAAKSASGLARKLKWRSWSVIAVVAVLLVCHQLLLIPVLSQLDTDGPLINIAGRQRMLSQKLAKTALALQAAASVEERTQRREELKQVVAEWSSAHQALKSGRSDRMLPAITDPQIRAAYQGLESHFEAILSAARVVLAPAATSPISQQQRSAIQTIMRHEDHFLTLMHQVVELHAVRSRARVSQLQGLGWGIAAVILVLLLTVQSLIIRPAMNVVGDRLALWEVQYRRLVDSMHEGLIVYDSRGLIQLANPRFCELVGLHVDDILGQQVSQFVADTHLRPYHTLFAAQRVARFPVELTLRPADGMSLQTMASIQSIPGDGDGSEVFLVVLTDITALKLEEKKTRELLEQLAHADRLKSMGELAAGLAHELNQPLAAIANFAEGTLACLRDPFPRSENLQAPVQRILSAALRGGEIIRRARRFSQPGVREVQPESLNDLVREVEQLFRHEALVRAVTVELELAADLPLLPLDGIQTQQVLANLIQNAFTAMEHADCRRRYLRIKTELESPSFARISVTDTGPGLSGVDTGRLFESFYTTKPNGLGLGLSISQKIVESHGGTIQAVDNRGPDGGATFRFTLATQSAISHLEDPAFKEEVAHV